MSFNHFPSLFLPKMLILTAFALPATPAVSVYPSSVTLITGQSRTFAASVKNVKWLVNNIPAGNAKVGTIDSSGKYQAPSSVPTPNVVTITGVNPANASDLASASVTLQNPVPVISSISLSQLNTKLAFVLTLSGSAFLPHATVAFSDGTPMSITAQTNSQITITGTTQMAAGGLIQVTVTNPGSGATTSAPKSIRVVGPVTVAVSSAAVTLRAGATRVFNATVDNALVKTVTWTLTAIDKQNHITTAPAIVGTIDAQGSYVAPAVVEVSSVTVTATSVADPAQSSSAVVTLQNPFPVIKTVTSPVVAGNVKLTIQGTGFAPSATVTGGGTAWTVTWLSTTNLIATGTVNPPVGQVITVKVNNPNPGGSMSAPYTVAVNNAGNRLTYHDARRFLEQATWGPTPKEIAHLQDIGIQAWLTEQFNMPASQYTPLPLNQETPALRMDQQFFQHALTGNDQLRQRVAFALGQIEVISRIKVGQYQALQSYQQLLLDDAFGTYKQLLKDVTLSPAMGHYLDMVNNDKPSATKSPDENYARELMQLFSIGLTQLNQDGTEFTTGNPAESIPSYTESDVSALSRVLTGWTYPACFAVSQWPNPSCFESNMIAIEAHHDRTAKSFLGSTIAAGGTAEADLDLALEAIESYPSPSAPNVAPFLALRLIQHFVTSNPSPAYVQAVASKYGSLQAMVTEVLTNPEARTDPNSKLIPPEAADNRGHLKEPILFVTGLLRALNATASTDSRLNEYTAEMGQQVFTSPTVFNFYSPFYQIPDTGVAGPEFQTLSQATAFARANFAWHVAANQVGPSISVDLTTWREIASDTNPTTQAASLNSLLNAINQALLGGPMSSDMAGAIMPALTATNNSWLRVSNALFLVAASSRYQVQR